MSRQVDLPEIVVGAEVHYFPGMSNSDMLPALTLNGTNYVLIEMRNSPWDESVYRELENVRIRQGLIPIIAHVDRYITPFRQHGIPDRLQSMDVRIQANAEFFLERSTAGMAMRMLKQGQIQLLGSDCHNMESRKPNLGEAVEKIRRTLGEEALDMIRDYESKVLGR